MNGVVSYMFKLQDLASNSLAKISSASNAAYFTLNKLNNEYTKKNAIAKNSIDKLREKIERLTENRNASTNITRIRAYNGEIRSLSKELGNLENLPPLSFRQRLMQSTDGLAKLIKGGIGIYAVTKGMQALSHVFRSGINMEQTQMSFEVMLKSADKAKKTLASLNQFANITPFDNEEVINSGKILLTASIPAEKLNSELKKVGDVASGANVPLTEMASIYAKAMNKGKVQAEELNQLAERGVPILDAFSKMLGVSKQEVLKLGEKGELSADLLSQAFEQMTSAGGIFENMMEKQSKTVGGRISTLIGNLQTIAISIGEAFLPIIGVVVDFGIKIIDAIKPIGVAFMQVVDAIRPLWDAILNLLNAINPFNGELGLLSALLTVITNLFSGVAWVFGLVADGLATISNLFADYQGLLITTAALLAAYVLWKKRAILVEKLHAIAMLFTGKVFKGLKLLMATNPFTAMLLGVGLVIGAVKKLIDHFNKTKRVVNELRAKTAEYAAQEQMNLNKLFENLNKTNPKSKERLELVKQLKEQYPELNKQQITELETATDLTSIYNQLADSILKKALAQAQQEMADEVMLNKLKAEKEQLMLVSQSGKSEAELRAMALAMQTDITGMSRLGSYVDSDLRYARQYANQEQIKSDADKELSVLKAMLNSGAEGNRNGFSDAINWKNKDTKTFIDNNNNKNGSNIENDVLNNTISGGSRPQNITITLNSLVDKLSINATTIKEGVNDMERMVTETLLRVLNSANAAV